ncbi:MAG TPA: DUF892 family protein [Bryobacteraceae bacterium]|nr:DUF892 family protein [Bryobacteraceae bacterium]
MEQSIEVLKRYIQDSIALERNFESRLRAFAKDHDRAEIQSLFVSCADHTKTQHERLDARLREIGGPPSAMKSFMTHMFGAMPRTGGLGKEDEERDTQDLMMAYAIGGAEKSMYEVLAAVANAAGDSETERLAREIQGEKDAMAAKVWSMLAPTARESFQRITETLVQQP